MATRRGPAAVERRDGRVLAFGGVPAVGFNLALEGLGAGGRLPHARGLHDGLVRPRPAPEDMAVFGRLLRGDADSCADDAIAVVRALRPDLLPSDLIRE